MPMPVNSKLIQSIYDMMSVIVTAVISIMIIFTFLFRTAGVIGGSMLPTLTGEDGKQAGDELIITAFDHKLYRGDIVIISQPNSFHEPIVKRVIGLPGQTININNGYVYVDKVRLDEPYTHGKMTELEDIPFPVTVPKGCVFVMGDNRTGSTDSRSRYIGFIDENYILGKAVIRVFPFNKISLIH